MSPLSILKLGVGGILGVIIAALWFGGGIIGCIIGIVKDEALYAVASLLVPGFGAIYTIISAFGTIF